MSGSTSESEGDATPASTMRAAPRGTAAGRGQPAGRAARRGRRPDELDVLEGKRPVESDEEGASDDEGEPDRPSVVRVTFPRPLRLRRPQDRLEGATARPLGRGARHVGRGGRGGRDRLLRRDRRRRPGPGTRSPRGPAQPAADLPAGAGFLLEGRPVVLSPRSPRRRRPGDPDRVRLVGSSTVRRPASPGRAGSTSRAATTPSWWSRSGATTCGSRASWSSPGGVDVLGEHLRDFRSGPATRRGPGRRPRRRVEGEADRRRGHALGDGPPRAGDRSPLHRHLAGRPVPIGWASRRGERARRRGLEEGHVPTLGWPHRDEAKIARAWKHVLGGVRGFQDLDQHCWSGREADRLRHERLD